MMASESVYQRVQHHMYAEHEHDAEHEDACDIGLYTDRTFMAW